ncbi:MAG TPA: glycosyltransferase family 4 protein [Ferruginibacter sp.]|nr:glycosyltransferase family 4 protein [Ferruginibacter sp.]HRO17817.1 glycosyltransferase family 4 protein [Ferruginibacter sp.]HRQ21253.1 glycosyltransferase family 4 protein [Ferruginibacter sp.]
MAEKNTHRKVLYLIDTLEMGGAEQSILEIASRFKNFSAVVCHIYPGHTLRPAYEAAGIEVVSLNLPTGSKHKVILPELLKVVERFQPVLIHASLYRSMMVSRKLKRITGLPLVNSFVSNSYAPARTDKLKWTTRLKLRYYQMLDASTSKIPDVYISNSNAIAESNAKALKISKSKIRVIHRGRSIERYGHVTGAQVAAVRSAMGLNNQRIVLNVGRLRQAKGQADLIRAFSKIHHLFPDSVLWIAGEGTYRSVLEQLVRELNLSEAVQLLGNRNDVEVLMAAADVFVFPSYYEGLPGVILEAMMAGKIIVASDIPENRECIDEYSALFFPVGDTERIALQVSNVLQDTQSFKGLGERASGVAHEKFDIHQIARQYEEVYQQLIQS